MVTRSGSADLPLHTGRVPAWLAQRMAALGRTICEAIVHHYGRDEFLNFTRVESLSPGCRCRGNVRTHVSGEYPS